MLAACHGHAASVRLLLAKGADPNLVDAKGQTPLAGVAFKGHVDVAEALVSGGANIDVVTADRRSDTMAAAFNRTEMITWLLAHGASPDSRDASGARAIDVATALGAADAVALLSGDTKTRRPEDPKTRRPTAEDRRR
jgi:ankyrin repeat protein